MNGRSYIACDLGASSGRVMVGTLRDGKLVLAEVHRFPNDALRIGGSLRWNVLRIFEELKAGLRMVAVSGAAPASLSVDSWGVDYVLIHEHEPMLGIPYQYRDSRTDGVYDRALKQAGAELIFAETGIQFMAINTLYQLIAESERNADVLGIAGQFLNIADYFNFLFSGVPRAEESLASTTQLYHPVRREWSAKLIGTFGLPPRIFPRIVSSGTRLGVLVPEIQEETRLPGIEVIATCSHDTGAAVAAVPAGGNDWAFLSAGTWSLIGVELPAPLINGEVRAHNFTNEASYGGTTRFLKNIIGMWLLQECQRTWQAQARRMDFNELTRLAAEAGRAFRSLFDPQDARFAKPDNMPEKIAAFCRETNQPVPESPGQFVRCIYESLALLYRRVLAELEGLTGRTIRRLHVVGGGSQSELFNQFVANTTGRIVLAGPVEATAAGNVLIQAITLGHLSSLQEARAIVRASFPIREYQPAQTPELRQAVASFAKISRRP